MKTAARRLTRGQDLKNELAAIVAAFSIKAGFVAALVGSLSAARLRLAGGNDIMEFVGEFEIVSATGTLCADGMHVHLAISDRHGTTSGGHLMDGCIILTTCEVVIIDISSQHTICRKEDANTGFKELVVN